jgi:hypothetical protein
MQEKQNASSNTVSTTDPEEPISIQSMKDNNDEDSQNLEEKKNEQTGDG